MSIIRLNSREKNFATPLVVFVIFQIEYISEGRAFYIREAEEEIYNASEILRVSRECRLQSHISSSSRRGNFSISIRLFLI